MKTRVVVDQAPTVHLDFVYTWLTNAWTHPESQVTILGEYMPWELEPTRGKPNGVSSA